MNVRPAVCISLWLTTFVFACSTTLSSDDQKDADQNGQGDPPGGVATGGAPTMGGSPDTGGTAGMSGDDEEEEDVPCGSGSFDAEVLFEDDVWIARNGNDQVYSGGSLLQAMRSAIASLTNGRTDKERVVVWDSGSIDETLDIPSYTIFESCGTINVSGGDAVRVRSNVDVPYLSLTGTPGLGIFIRQSSDIHLGKIDLRFSNSGRGIRIDNNNNESNCWGRCNRITNIQLDDVYVEGTSGHGVETYGVDGLVIGRVVARNTGDAGLLLNATANAEIGVVDGDNAAYIGTGYAAFRMANENGRLANFGNFNSPNVDSDYAPNIHVGEVRARRGGRGIFCVSGSGGAVIDRIDIADVGNSPGIFIEDCYNIAISGGTYDGGTARRGINITARGPSSTHATFLHYSTGIHLENLEVFNTPINESNCGAGGNNIVRNNTLVASSLSLCPGTDGGGNVIH